MKKCERCSRPEIGKTVIHVGECPKDDWVVSCEMIEEMRSWFGEKFIYRVNGIEIPVWRSDLIPSHHMICGIAE